MSAFDDMLSFGEASKIWELDDSTLRKAVASGKLKPDIDCRKFGKQWVVLKSAVAREFGGWAKHSVYMVEQRKKEIAERGY